MCRGPHKLKIVDFLWSCWQALPTLPRNCQENSDWEYWILISWLNKSDNWISKDQKCTCSPKPIKAGFWHQNFHSDLCLWEANTLCCLLPGWVPVHLYQIIMATGSANPPEVIDIPDEEVEEQDWPETGPVNPAEAKQYMDCITDVFDSLSDLLHKDKKDDLPKVIRSFCKLIVRHWESISDAYPEVVIWSITDPACIYQRQHITKGGMDVVIPDEEPPSGHDFIRKLPKKWRCQEEIELIISVFDHASEVHTHLATVAANLSSLVKVTNCKTLQIVMRSAICPLMQMHILEGFLDPVEDKRPQTMKEEWLQKVKKMVLPKHKAACLAHNPKNSPMIILVVAMWLKLHHKYFNQGTAKEACELFQVCAKQLLRVLTGKKYQQRFWSKDPRKEEEKCTLHWSHKEGEGTEGRWWRRWWQWWWQRCMAEGKGQATLKSSLHWHTSFKNSDTTITHHHWLQNEQSSHHCARSPWVARYHHFIFTSFTVIIPVAGGTKWGYFYDYICATSHSCLSPLPNHPV